MKKIIYDDVMQNPFRKTTAGEQITQCSPDNPFGVQRRPPPELRSMEGIHYTRDPKIEQIRKLRAYQNVPKAAIGAAVAVNIVAALEAIKSINALMWASGIIKAVLDYTNDISDDARDENDKIIYEKDSEPSNNQGSGATERIDRYKERQDIKSSDAGANNDVAESTDE